MGPAATRSGGRGSGAEDDLDVGAAPFAQDEVREHLRAGGEGSRSAICAPCDPTQSAQHDACHMLGARLHARARRSLHSSIRAVQKICAELRKMSY